MADAMEMPGFTPAQDLSAPVASGVSIAPSAAAVSPGQSGFVAMFDALAQAAASAFPGPSASDTSAGTWSWPVTSVSTDAVEAADLIAADAGGDDEDEALEIGVWAVVPQEAPREVSAPQPIAGSSLTVPLLPAQGAALHPRAVEPSATVSPEGMATALVPDDSHAVAAGVHHEIARAAPPPPTPTPPPTPDAVAAPRADVVEFRPAPREQPRSEGPAPVRGAATGLVLEDSHTVAVDVHHEIARAETPTPIPTPLLTTDAVAAPRADVVEFRPAPREQSRPGGPAPVELPPAAETPVRWATPQTLIPVDTSAQSARVHAFRRSSHSGSSDGADESVGRLAPTQSEAAERVTATVPLGSVVPTLVTPTRDVLASQALSAHIDPPQTEDGETLVPSLIKTMTLQTEAGGGTVLIRLRPEWMGPLQVSLRIDQGVVKAVITVESAATAEFLRAEAPALIRALEEQGLQIERFEIRSGPTAERDLRDSSERRQRQARRDWTAPAHRSERPDATFDVVA